MKNARKSVDPNAELERRIYTVLKTYSNVHRGSGHHSAVTTHLYDQARVVVLDYLGLSKSSHEVIFGSRRLIEGLSSQLVSGQGKVLSSRNAR